MERAWSLDVLNILLYDRTTSQVILTFHFDKVSGTKRAHKEWMPLDTSKCFSCGEVGHIARGCPKFEATWVDGSWTKVLKQPKGKRVRPKRRLLHSSAVDPFTPEIVTQVELQESPVTNSRPKITPYLCGRDLFPDKTFNSGVLFADQIGQKTEAEFRSVIPATGNEGEDIASTLPKNEPSNIVWCFDRPNCRRCGSTTHPSTLCHTRQIPCTRCHEVGHIRESPMCYYS